MENMSIEVRNIKKLKRKVFLLHSIVGFTFAHSFHVSYGVSIESVIRPETGNVLVEF